MKTDRMKTDRRNELLVAPEQLQALMQSSSVKLVDSSWYLPDQARDGHAEYMQQRLPGAVFFDIDQIADVDSELPHTLASPEVFAERVGRLGIGIDDTIVVYDAAGLFTAPRVAWNFRQMGASDVRVLDGGMPAWVASGGATESDTPAEPIACDFMPNPIDGLTTDREALQRHLSQGTALVLDVRPGARFSGQAKEPRPGVRSGHMPGAVNLPFPDLLLDGALLPNEQLRQRFDAVGVSADHLVITSCGSGVTAAIAILALECLGHQRHALYDGSWSEWGAHPDTPVVTD